MLRRVRLALGLVLSVGSLACGTTTPKAETPAASYVAPTVTPPVVAVEVPKPQAQTIDLEVTPESSIVSTSATEAFVRVRLSGLSASDGKRPPLNLALVVDTSGSMAGDAIVRAKEACGKLVDAMSEGDILSLVSFGSKATVLVHAVAINAGSRAAAHKSIDAIVADGTTDMTGGLQAGIAEVSAQLSADKINRIILMGDGVPNDPGTMLGLAARSRDLRVPITTLGLGGDFDETQMTAIATTSGGAFHFVDDAKLVADVFRDEILKMQRLTARNVQLEFTPGPGVSIIETLGLPFAGAGRGGVVTVGDLAEGQVRDVIVHVRLTPRAEGSKLELLDTTARYVPASATAPMQLSKFLGLDVSNDAIRTSDATNQELSHQVARLRVADNIVRAIALARAGDVTGARSLLDVTIKLATDSGKKFEDADLTEKAKEALKLKGTVASLAPPPVAFMPAVADGTGSSAHIPSSAPMPVPPALSPKAALDLRSIHGASEHELQGFR